MNKYLAALIMTFLIVGCSKEEFDQDKYLYEVGRLADSAVIGNIYTAEVQEVGRGDVRVNLNFSSNPGDLSTARMAAMGYCQRLVSLIHEKLDDKFPNLTFASCRAGMNRGGMRDVYGVVRYGSGVGFEVKEK